MSSQKLSEKAQDLRMRLGKLNAEMAELAKELCEYCPGLSNAEMRLISYLAEAHGVNAAKELYSLELHLKDRE